MIAAIMLLTGVTIATLRAAESASVDHGVELSELSPVVDNPHVGFGSLKRAVYTGRDRDSDTGKTSKIRMEVTVRDTAVMLVGIKVMVLDILDFQDEVQIEAKRNYYAQDKAGGVYCLAEHVDDVVDGKVVGHDGQWTAGEKGAKAGFVMPPAPKVGDVFEPERAPGIARDRSKVVAVGKTVKVAAGTFTGCIETESFDPIEKTSQRRIYAPGVGLVKESSPERTIELASRETR
ncbi:MAG TPA: hypothetical protein VJY35_09435 [Candidatus Eisenbacteria bacterium]|nr:hypothetical protein [Candidatus Eisenbacteria bacterium]